MSVTISNLTLPSLVVLWYNKLQLIGEFLGIHDIMEKQQKNIDEQ